MIYDPQALVGFSVAALTLIGLLAAGVRWVRPRWRAFWRDLRAGRDALVGREPVVDSITGKEIAPALPGIGQRMATVEQALVTLADNQVRLAEVERTVALHAEEIHELRQAGVERIVARAESTAAFRAMEAAMAAEPPEDSPEL